MEIGKIFDQICARKWRLLNLREYLCYLAARMWPPSDRFSMASIIFFEAWMKDEKPAFLSEGLEFEIFVDDVTLTDWPTGILLDRGHLSAKRCHLLITPVTETAA